MLFIKDRIEESIEIMRTLEPTEGYYLAFSGGKDSVVLYDMAVKAGVKFDAHYHITTADPPELIRFIRNHYSSVIWDKPEMTMWELIPSKCWPPTRVQRYCCEKLKDSGGVGRVVLTGVKKSDSSKRRKTLTISCGKRGTTVVHPLLNWVDEEIWEHIHGLNLYYCELYDLGYSRLGCVGCPLIGPDKQRKEFKRWPKYREMYVRAFGRMISNRNKLGKEQIWKTGEEVMSWWLGEGGQLEGVEMKGE